ncbi:TonB family protein [Rhodoferax sp. AJA081-3]|uniref:energy transducer TonB n=1 Tax=Rhodoferax sp. AJA081-3 TaxID=2752316 RepID=UPI001ADF5207|nr:energy transducer TonB [Rhodoferax sp. AJA081-3]QTN28860.1 TonB family protein [Rhodoferax sp. AJA081-3]
MSRNLRIVGIVLLLHVGALWALQAGLLRRVVEVFVPAQVLVEMHTPQEDKPAPPPPVPTPIKTRQTPVTPPTPLAVTTPTPQPSEITLAPVDPSPPVTAAVKASSNATATATTAAPPAPPKVELPSSDADYLNNPFPPYPALSKRMGEQGKVIIRTLIGADGTAQDASVFKSSGFDRLDQAALATARKWRYVPGKRAGVAEAMWFNVPFTFVLE